MKKIYLILFLVFTIGLKGNLSAEELHFIDNSNLMVYFDPLLESAAMNVIDIYPEIKSDVEITIRWKYDFRPTVFLIKNRNHFFQNDLIVAYAVPKQAAIVIDYSKAGKFPFRLETILKHEFCHLLLNYHIKKKVLPRWLDEGIAQWISDSIGEIIFDQKRSLLNRAAFSGRFIRLAYLKNGFPDDREPMLLAYEESKSFIEFILGNYGRDSILTILNYLKNGEEVDPAFIKVLPDSLEGLEKQWQQSLRKKTTWVTYLSYHVYEILFAFMALISIFGFIKLLMKKHSYMKDEEEDTA
ncbi:MAG TPA: peptidase MA family metallohydrolase [Desulfobacteraceae bacterium]|nr:peptidase MA family metallohydrolase [Desulfobacteraceae bacterium]HPJ68399.1 peptidase MA family metallohydrolase [Desulfobacteraceae bacterium]HPQ27231.1 peptidase MA family metallohydrolase [Desulfobacteraceae bacterium]